MENEKLSDQERKRQAKLANELAVLNSCVNEGVGLRHLKYVIEDLRAGRLDLARVNCRNQSDKFDRIPRVRVWVIENLFKGVEDHPWVVEERLRKEREKGLSGD